MATNLIFVYVAGIYLTCTMAITTLSMVLTVFVLNLHHISDRPVPRWARKLVLCYIARLLCMCSYTSPMDEDEAVSKDSSKTDDKKNKYRITPNTLSKAIGSQLGILTNLNGTLGSSPSSSSRSRDDKPLNFEKHSQKYNSQYTFSDEPAVTPKQEKKDLKRLEELWAREWRRLAEVVDRLFFWIFLSAIVITTLLLFHPLTKSYFSLLGDETILGDKSGDTEPTETAN